MQRRQLLPHLMRATIGGSFPATFRAANPTTNSKAHTDRHTDTHAQLNTLRAALAQTGELDRQERRTGSLPSALTGRTHLKMSIAISCFIPPASVVLSSIAFCFSAASTPLPTPTPASVPAVPAVSLRVPAARLC